MLVAPARATGPAWEGWAPNSVSVESVSVALTGTRPILSDVTFDVPRGAAIALLGPSGSGKTTLLRVMAGLVAPAHGRVSWNLPNTAPIALHRKLGRIGYIPQHLGLVRNRRVIDNVLAGALWRTPRWRAITGAFLAADVEAAHAALASVGLVRKAYERVHRLSGGEKQRVAIARTLVQRPAILFADEFVSNLDERNAAAVLDLVNEMRRRGVTVVMALHNIELARTHADEIVFLNEGRITAHADARKTTPEEIRSLLA